MKKELVLVAIALMIVLLSLPQMDHHVDPWLNPVVLEGELEAANWAKSTPQGSLFLAGIFGGELIMGTASRTSLVGGDWAANVNSPQQMSDMHEFYLTSSADEAERIWNKYNASYAWFPARSVYAGYGWIDLDEEKMNDSRFEVVYKNNEVTVYKLRKSS